MLPLSVIPLLSEGAKMLIPPSLEYNRKTKMVIKMERKARKATLASRLYRPSLAQSMARLFWVWKREEKRRRPTRAVQRRLAVQRQGLSVATSLHLVVWIMTRANQYEAMHWVEFSVDRSGYAESQIGHGQAYTNKSSWKIHLCMTRNCHSRW